MRHISFYTAKIMDNLNQIGYDNAMQTLKAGTKILCPKKRHLVGALNADQEVNKPMRVDKITFEPGQERIAGELMACKTCGSVYFLQGKIYTENGWSPSDPHIEPVTRR